MDIKLELRRQKRTAQEIPERRRILIVEDDDSIRELLATHFEKQGFAVLACATGKSSITEGLRFDPDLAVFDIDLPDMLGSEVLAVLLKVRERPLHSVFLSSLIDPSPHLYRKVLVHGQDFRALPKCVKFAELRKALDSAVAKDANLACAGGAKAR